MEKFVDIAPSLLDVTLESSRVTWLLSASLVLCRIDAASTAPAQHRIITDADRSFWSFRPVSEVQPSSVAQERPTVNEGEIYRNITA